MSECWVNVYDYNQRDPMDRKAAHPTLSYAREGSMAMRLIGARTLYRIHIRPKVQFSVIERGLAR